MNGYSPSLSFLEIYFMSNKFPYPSLVGTSYRLSFLFYAEILRNWTLSHIVLSFPILGQFSRVHHLTVCITALECICPHDCPTQRHLSGRYGDTYVYVIKPFCLRFTIIDFLSSYLPSFVPSFLSFYPCSTLPSLPSFFSYWKRGRDYFCIS